MAHSVCIKEKDQLIGMCNASLPCLVKQGLYVKKNCLLPRIWLMFCAALLMTCVSATEANYSGSEAHAKESYNSTETQESNNSSAALDGFGMVFKTGGIQSFKEENFVVRKGAVSDKWTETCRHSPKTTDGDQACMPQTFDEHHDQVTFEFLYDDPSLYLFKRPTIEVEGGRAEPQVRDYSNDLDEKSGEITIRHGCSPVSQGQIVSSVISMTFAITSQDSIVVTWTKQCGFGEHGKIDYGWFTLDKDGDLDKPKSLRNPNLGPIFGPRSLSTRVYLTLFGSAHSQYYDTPVVSSKAENDANEAVGVELRGSNFGGVVLSSSYMVFDVMYNCLSKGRSVVNVTVGIAPFNAIRMHWHKDCGGGIGRRIQVGKRSPGWKGGYALGDVVQNGSAIGKYAEKHEQDGRSSGMNGKTRTTTRLFYMWVRTNWSEESGSIEEDGEEIGEMSAHSDNDRIAVAGIIGTGGQSLITRSGEHGGGLGWIKTIRVWTKCARRGRVRVRVTVTVRDRLPVEWWFDDVCSRRRLKNRNAEAGFTAAQVMRVSTGMFAIAMGVWMWRGFIGVGKRDTGAVLRREWRHV